MLVVGCCLLIVVSVFELCCLLFVVCRLLLFVVWCLRFVISCSWFADSRLLFVKYYLLLRVSCVCRRCPLLVVGRSSLVVRCLLFAVACVCLFVVCCWCM